MFLDITLKIYLIKINDRRNLTSLSPRNIFTILFISTVSYPLIFFRININILSWHKISINISVYYNLSCWFSILITEQHAWYSIKTVFYLTVQIKSLKNSFLTSDWHSINVSISQAFSVFDYKRKKVKLGKHLWPLPWENPRQ